jgi:sugar/nucleoside kinase (ribokinase family)
MRKIFAIGETVLDIIFKNGQPAASNAGGAMLNTAVSLGRLGLPVHFISEYGTDQVGVLIDHFLNCNGINAAGALCVKRASNQIQNRTVMAKANRRNNIGIFALKDGILFVLLPIE